MLRIMTEVLLLYRCFSKNFFTFGDRIQILNNRRMFTMTTSCSRCAELLLFSVSKFHSDFQWFCILRYNKVYLTVLCCCKCRIHAQAVLNKLKRVLIFLPCWRQSFNVNCKYVQNKIGKRIMLTKQFCHFKKTVTFMLLH